MSAAPPDIFISYAREDVEWVRPLAAELEANGWRVFWDRRIPAGQTWRSHIGKALRAARCVVVVWSVHSVESDWVIEEADQGKKRQVLVPVFKASVEPPMGFGQIQAADLSSWRYREPSDEFDVFLSDVAVVLGSATQQDLEPPAGAGVGAHDKPPNIELTSNRQSARQFEAEAVEVETPGPWSHAAEPACDGIAEASGTTSLEPARALQSQPGEFAEVTPEPKRLALPLSPTMTPPEANSVDGTAASTLAGLEQRSELGTRPSRTAIRVAVPIMLVLGVIGGAYVVRQHVAEPWQTTDLEADSVSAPPTPVRVDPGAAQSPAKDVVETQATAPEPTVPPTAPVPAPKPPVTPASADTKAAAQYRQAAEQGDADAQVNLGFMYENGRGVAQDDAQAVAWYRKAAEQGNAYAQVRLGWMYEDGRGVAQDDAQAVAWYRKAAEQGNAIGQYDLGIMYENGRGVAQDDAQAVAWYRKAAEQGNAGAQGNLGWMYANGRGVTKDLAQARIWYGKAADQGDRRAQDLLRQLD